MAKVQTRRTLSVSGSTYRRLREFCDVEGCSMSVVAEAALAAVLAVPPHPPVLPERGHFMGVRGRRARYVTAAGATASLATWAEWLGISRERARQLANRGLLVGRIEAEALVPAAHGG